VLTHVNDLTRIIIGAAIEVHRHLGPGLLESAYHVCLARELEILQIPFKFKWPLPLEYKGLRLPKGYEMDLLVANSVVVECKSVVTLAPVHEAQLLTYLRLANVKVGLLMNFNVVVLKDGIRRRVLNLEE
jgi:GxxExxY protein